MGGGDEGSTWSFVVVMWQMHVMGGTSREQEIQSWGQGYSMQEGYPLEGRSICLCDSRKTIKAWSKQAAPTC